jgi:ATP-dependent DNA helicase RecG
MTNQLKEDSTTEFKSSFSDATIESLVAFANTKGGRILIGMDSKAKPIKGFTIGDESIQNWINEIKNKTQPSLIPDADFITIEDTVIVQLSINEFPIKPVSYKGRYFKRIKNSNHQLTTNEISELHLQSLQLSWDSYPYLDGYFDDLNKAKISQFIKRINNGGRFVLPKDPFNALFILKLIKKDSVTNAAMILFSKENYFIMFTLEDLRRVQLSSMNE